MMISIFRFKVSLWSLGIILFYTCVKYGRTRTKEENG